MIIDLFTVIAQIINFLILILLLKKFLFNKIISIMDERERQIGEQLTHAEQEERKAREEVKKQKKIREELEQEWDENLARIKKEIQSKQEEMMKEARKSVDEAEKSWKNSLEKQRTAFLGELRQLSCQQVCQISKKVLADLANEKLEKHLIDSFLSQLENMQQEKKKNLNPSEMTKNNQIEIWTAFKLDKQDKDRLTEKLGKILDNKTEIVFKDSDHLICGIELRSEGKKVAWSMESYLDSLENRLKQMFEDVKFKENNRSQENDIEKKE